MTEKKKEPEGIVSKLSRIQGQLNAPKGQTNAFGKYKYRSCEDILEALKPLLAKECCVLIITDDTKGVTVEEDGIDAKGNKYSSSARIYIKSTATIRYGDETVSVDGLAREPQSKKGMDDAQLTGATSSYARKYALNGLFAIDDCKDADTMDNRAGTPNDRGKDAPPEPVIERASDYDMRMALIGDWRKEINKERKALGYPIVQGGVVMTGIKRRFKKLPDQMNNKELDEILPFLVKEFNGE